MSPSSRPWPRRLRRGSSRISAHASSRSSVRGVGDFARSYDTTVQGMSSHFVWLNRSKESLTLDLKHTEAIEVLRRLLARADVFIHNLAPGAMARLGFASVDVRREHPRLIVCEVSGYGSIGSVSRQEGVRPARAERGRVCCPSPAPGRAGEGRHLGRGHLRRHVRVLQRARCASSARENGRRIVARGLALRLAGRVDVVSGVLLVRRHTTAAQRRAPCA